MKRKHGRNKRRRMGRLFPLTLKERDKRDERRFRTGKFTGKSKIEARGKVL